MVDFEEDIKNAIKTLETGGSILYPTDTVWGLGCDAFDEKAVECVFTIKNRPKEKSLIILVADVRDILLYTAAPPPDFMEILEGFEKPTTVIYEHALGFPENVTSPDGSIAIRITKDPFCKALIKRFRRPIVSTSANISGQPTPRTFPEIDRAILGKVDYIVRYRRDDLTIHQPSSLVKLLEDGSLEILRP